MKTKSTPIESLGDENVVVDLHEMITLLIGKDIESQKAFRNEVFRRAAEIRKNGNPEAKSLGNTIDFPMKYSCSA